MERHISEAVAKDEKFKAARQHEQEAHDRLEKTLTGEQLQLFNHFISAASETNANTRRIHYQQGMKDLFSLIKSLLK